LDTKKKPTIYGVENVGSENARYNTVVELNWLIMESEIGGPGENHRPVASH